MKIETLVCEKHELRSTLLPRLLGEVFHVTTGTGFARVRQSGKILANVGGRFPSMTPQSPVSFGRSIGAVSLVDLRSATAEIIDDALDRYYFLDPFSRSRVNVFLLLDPSALSALVPNHAGRTNPERLVAVPNIEVWHPGPLSLTDIKSAIRVPCKRPRKWDWINHDALKEILAERRKRRRQAP